jgi:hypothetical protein
MGKMQVKVLRHRGKPLTSQSRSTIIVLFFSER